MSSLFKTKLPPQPTIPAPVRMPDAEDPASIEARRKRLATIAQRGGRDSTILSDNLSEGMGKLGA